MVTRYKQQESGLIVPDEKQESKNRKYGPLELQDKEEREKAARGLSLLWDAMGLSMWSPLTNQSVYSARYQVYRFIGEMLLGKDCPEKETLT